MRSLKKCAVVTIAMIMAFSCLSACGKKKEEQEVTEQEAKTGYKLVENGNTEYQILLPAEPTEQEKIAAEELNFFFSEATGITMQIVYETDEQAKAGQYISVGETNLYNNSKIKFDYKPLGSSGFGLKLSEDDVYIIGSERGVVFGAYEFLERQFDYSYVDDGVYTIEKNVTDEDLLDLNIEFKPSIAYRYTTHGYEDKTKDAMYLYRMKYDESYVLTGMAGRPWHNYLTAIPVEKYYDEHPEWFSPKKDQLCLTRDREGLAQEMANVIKQQILDAKAAGKEIQCIHVGHEDHGVWCGCTSCVEVINKYGGYHVATGILFMNALSDAITPWMEETGNVVDFTTFAYHETENAPVVYNEKTNTYDLISDDLILRDNVNILYAPINADYYSPFDEENNETTYTNFQGWSQVSKNLYVWVYAETFKNYLVPFDNFNSLKSNVRILEEVDTIWCTNQGQWNNGNSTGFSHLKAYINIKLMWNSNYDINELIKEYCDACYGDASSIMQDILNEYKLWRAYNYYEGGQDGNLHTEPTAEHWDATLLKRWLGMYEDAFSAIKKYEKTDKELYNRLYDTILLESMSYRYLLINFFPNECGSVSELREMKTEWKMDAARLGLTMYTETQPLTNLYKEWGI